MKQRKHDARLETLYARDIHFGEEDEASLVALQWLEMKRLHKQSTTRPHGMVTDKNNFHLLRGKAIAYMRDFGVFMQGLVVEGFTYESRRLTSGNGVDDRGFDPSAAAKIYTGERFLSERR